MTKRCRIKRIIALACAILMPIVFLTGCRDSGQDDLPLSGKKFAIVVKIGGNTYFETIIKGIYPIFIIHRLNPVHKSQRNEEGYFNSTGGS